jgi:Fur family transcriptional regulator, ferric uptake regulator
MAPREWEQHALEALRSAGYRSGGARRRVVDLLARQDCALSPLEMDRRLRGVGRASVYRALDQLEELGLIQRVELGGDASGYERRGPASDHHHHALCEGCGRVAPFSDERLERAIAACSRGSEYEISTHEVVLRGTCPDCSGRRA